MAKLNTEKTPGGAQQYVRKKPGKTKSRTVLDLKHTSSGGSDPKTTALSDEIMAAKLGGAEARAAFKEKHGVTPSKAENMIDAAFGTEIDKATDVTSMEKFSQDLMKKEKSSGKKNGGMIRSKESTMKKKKKGMAMGGKVKAKGMAAGGAVLPMGKDPKTGKSIPKFAMDGKGKMAKGGTVKAKGMAMGGKVKSKGMAMGGKVKAKGMAMGGKVKAKGMAMGGKVKAKGYANGGRVRAGDVRFNNKRGLTY